MSWPFASTRGDNDRTPSRETEMADFHKTLVRATETRSFHVERNESAGWRTLAIANDRVAHEQERTEWHRVERDLERFAREIEQLRRDGWRDA
jgi:hypothetical protein